MPYTWDDLLDPNNAILIAIASGTILYGSYRSNDFYTNFKESFELENNVIKTRTAIIMPIVGSVFLLLLFYFMNWLIYLLYGLMALSSLSAFGFFIYPFCDLFCNRLGGIFKKSWNIRWFGTINCSGIFSFLASLAIVISWLLTFNFVIINVLAICLAISALSFLRLPNLKVSAIVLILFFLYDIFWVFISPYIFKESVMVNVATQVPTLPMVIVVPRVLKPGASLLGVGDIVLPGLFLSFLYRFDKQNNTHFLKGYFVRSWFAYIPGLMVTLVMLLVLQKGQPALLYLVPFVMTTAVFFGWIRGELKKLWTGIVDSPVSISEEVGLDTTANSSNEDTASLLLPVHVKEPLENEDTKQV